MIVVWGILILAVANAVTIGVMLLIRRGAPEGGYFADSDRASGVFGVLATGFAIFAGFVIFLGFTSYDQSRSGGETEALTVAQQVETAQFLPPAGARAADREPRLLRPFGHSPGMAGDGGRATDDVINPWGLALFRTLEDANPQSTTEEAAFGKWLDQTSAREEARRDRIHGAAGIVPASIWIVLIAIAVVVFAFILFYADSGERARSQAMLMGSATTIVVATLLAIYAFDNPYQPGPGSIQPTAMERSLSLIDQARAALGDTTPLPCDEQGAAP